MSRLLFFIVLNVLLFNKVILAQINHMGTISGGVCTKIAVRQDGVMFAATQSKIYRSTDIGETWQYLWWSGSSLGVDYIRFDGEGRVYVADGGGLSVSEDDGISWSNRTIPEQIHQRLKCIEIIDGTIYASPWSGGLFYSNDQGQTWNVDIEPENPFNPINDIIKTNNFFFIVTSWDKVYRKEIGDTVWSPSSNGLDAIKWGELAARLVKFSNNYIFAVGGQGNFASFTQWYLSKDGGENWEYVQNDFGAVGNIFVDGNDKLWGYTIDGIISSSDYCETWNLIPYDSTLFGDTYYSFCVTPNQDIFVATSDNAIVKLNLFSKEWEISNKDLSGLSALDAIFVNDTLFVAGDFGGIFRSNDFGSSWFSFSKGYYDKAKYLAKNNDNELFVNGYWVSKFNKSQKSWQRIYLPQSPAGYLGLLGRGLYIDQNDVMYAPNVYHCARSVDNDTTWEKIYDDDIHSFAFTDSNSIYIATNDSIMVSNDNCTTWNSICSYPGGYGLNLKIFSSYILIYSGTGLYGSYNGFYYSTNFGTDWIEANNEVFGPYKAFSVTDIVVDNNGYFFVGRRDDPWDEENLSGKIFISKDKGITWSEFCELPDKYSITALTIDEYNNLYAITDYNNNVYKIDVDVILSTDEDTDKTLDFRLSQNYPNPFNPTTTIEYTIPKSGLVSLEIYDILGRKIKTLFHKAVSPGSYKVDFNAENLSSGVYFYKLETGDYSAVKKLLLIK